MCFLTGLYKLYYNTRILSLFANQDRYLAFLQKNNYVFELLLQLTILQIADFSLQFLWSSAWKIMEYMHVGPSRQTGGDFPLN